MHTSGRRERQREIRLQPSEAELLLLQRRSEQLIARPLLHILLQSARYKNQKSGSYLSFSVFSVCNNDR